MSETNAVADIAQVRTNSNSSNSKALRAIVLGGDTAPRGKAQLQKFVGEDEPGESKALPDDPFASMELAGDILTPPFDLLTLSMLPEHSTELNQCVEAMEVNIEGFGHRLVPRVDPDGTDTPQELAGKVRSERVKLENFFTYANIDDSFVSLRRKRRRDLETTGNAYWEVIRGATGKIQGFEYVPSYQMRLGPLDEQVISVNIPIIFLHDDNSVSIDTIPYRKRFRQYVQTRLMYTAVGDRATDYRMVYFKEFGDPRVYNNTTGTEVPPEQVSNFDGKGTPMPESLKSNEIVHWRIPSARSPYGIPRYIGNLLSIFGDRKAEEINFTTFENNCVPSLMLLVSNGQLTQGSVERIQEYIDTQIRGGDNRSRFLIIEAESADQFGQQGEESGLQRIHVEKLRDQQHDDALFQKYSENNQDKIRRAFRLPPILVGRSDNYNRATAETSRKLADEQVFAPERSEFDNWVNRCLFPAMGVVYHQFKSNTPNTTDNMELIKILSGSEKTGGITPRIARDILADVLGKPLPEFPEGFDADTPFSLAMAEAVKNKAQASEPGQQVTALKRIVEDVEDAVAPLLEAMADANK